jgi:hypothetical protein
MRFLLPAGLIFPSRATRLKKDLPLSALQGKGIVVRCFLDWVKKSLPGKKPEFLKAACIRAGAESAKNRPTEMNLKASSNMVLVAPKDVSRSG